MGIFTGWIVSPKTDEASSRMWALRYTPTTMRKLRLYKHGQEWDCVSGRIRGTAATPRKAYDIWLLARVNADRPFDAP